MTDTPTFSYSYMITNRKLDPLTKVPYDTIDEVRPFTDSPVNGLYFFTATGSYNNSPSAFKLENSHVSDPLTTWQATFKSNLIADLSKTSSSSNPSLTVYIHGMGNDWPVAANSSMQFGQALQSGYSQYATPKKSPPPTPICQYNGLLIGFSWPSLDGHDSFLNYGAYNPTVSPPKTESTPNIRANILGSLGSFQTLMTLLADLANEVSGLTINIICHSEGNYMMMEGMQYCLNNSASVSIQQAILLAADVNNGALENTAESGSSNDLTTGISTGPGSGEPIAKLSNPVAVFYSNNDDTLEKSLGLGAFHNQSYLSRLGRAGPSTFASGTLMAGVSGIDCSTVASGSTGESSTPLGELYNAGWIPKNEETGVLIPLDLSTHGSYRFVPQILWVISQLLTSDGSFATLPYRVQPVPHIGTSFLMNFDTPPSSS